MKMGISRLGTEGWLLGATTLKVLVRDTETTVDVLRLAPDRFFDSQEQELDLDFQVVYIEATPTLISMLTDIGTRVSLMGHVQGYSQPLSTAQRNKAKRIRRTARQQVAYGTRSWLHAQEEYFKKHEHAKKSLESQAIAYAHEEISLVSFQAAQKRTAKSLSSHVQDFLQNVQQRQQEITKESIAQIEALSPAIYVLTRPSRIKVISTPAFRDAVLPPVDSQLVKDPVYRHERLTALNDQRRQITTHRAHMYDLSLLPPAIRFQLMEGRPQSKHKPTESE
ncbi:hypothetical protein [Lacticaseibacillus mingshuiensis]|uniref:Uncharacterized protein n=1 Tax=Lacticaseibacillus mingshuiensis TaxID=2799574 RepID=A0ABW4CHF3_9LACO|nr:hypothetical protein [Lacticaseibacillus mingshuiensis]